MSKFHNAKNRSKPLIDSFHEKYVKGLEGDCWVWIASKMRTGYGQINARDGRIVTAHRLSYQLHKGEIPSGMFVCHTCDNRACVNPDHLWLGTPKDNIQDMMKKGRAVRNPARGTKNHAAKLTENQVAEIYTSRKSNVELAKQFGVTAACVFNIKNGFSWSHFTQQLGPAHKPKSRKLNGKDARAIYQDSRKQCEIAKEYGVQPNMISRIKSGKRYAAATQDLRERADA